jgi:N-acyl homoserine lactone hydrolase
MRAARSRDRGKSAGNIMTFTKLACTALALLLLGAPAQAMTVRLWRLDCGAVQVNDLNLFSDSYGYAGRSQRLTDSCYLIQHGADYMLWDTGLPAALLGKPIGNELMSPSLTETLAKQLGTLDVRPDQITLIGISHYHFDHVGQAAEFPKAKLLIGKADVEALAAQPVPFGAEPRLLAPWLNGQAPLEAVSGDKDVFGDGTVTMLSMPGHTPGSYALLVRLLKLGRYCSAAMSSISRSSSPPTMFPRSTQTVLHPSPRWIGCAQ